jgi:hypothetical protein
MPSSWRFVFHQDDASDPGGVLVEVTEGNSVTFMAPSTFAMFRDQPLHELVAEWNEANPDSPVDLKEAPAVL